MCLQGIQCLFQSGHSHDDISLPSDSAYVFVEPLIWKLVTCVFKISFLEISTTEECINKTSGSSVHKRRDRLAVCSHSVQHCDVCFTISITSFISSAHTSQETGAVVNFHMGKCHW